MRRLIKLIAFGLLVSAIGRAVLKGQAGPERVQKTFMDMMPQMLDRAFTKLDPEKRRQMLARCHTVLSKLDEKYGEGAAETPLFEAQPTA